MGRGKRLPLEDIRRLARMESDYAAGLLTNKPASGNENQRGGELTPFVLLEPYAVTPRVGDPDSAQYGRYLSARAVQLVPTEQRVQVLRPIGNYPVNQPIVLSYEGQDDNALRITSDEEELFAILNGFPGLQHEIEVIGHGAKLGEEEEVEYTGRQWHIKYSDKVEGDLVALGSPVGPMRLSADYLWPSGPVRKLFPGLPTTVGQLAAGAMVWAVPLPGFGWVQLIAECFNPED